MVLVGLHINNWVRSPDSSTSLVALELHIRTLGEQSLALKILFFGLLFLKAYGRLKMPSN